MTVTVNPPPAHTPGQTVDADLAAIKQWIAVQDANVKHDASDVWAWVKTNWAHFVSWAGVGLTALKVFGKL